MISFETALPRLVATYETGRLVPFIGSGMSVPVCSDWRHFIRGLEEIVPPPTGTVPIDDDTPHDELIRRANNAVRVLKAREPGAFEQAVRGALVSAKAPEIPKQTIALAKLWWPLVLSTNYDNCYEAAFHAQSKNSNRNLVVVGRSIEDCQRVLNSLSVAGRSLLWSLQGYLGTPHSIPSDDSRSADNLSKLREQLVVGHEEYRRVTYRDLHFRRAFAEVFRQRSLLFLGSGIQETYLQELFGEVLENYGPSTRPHYAFIQKGEVDAEFMQTRFQIIAIEYEEDQHQTVCEWLDKLAEAAGLPGRAPVTWSWGRIVRQQQDHWTSTPDLEVVRGPLPTTPLEGECLAVSAGGASRFFFSKGIRSLMETWGIADGEQPEELASRYLGVFPGRHVYAVRARSDLDTRSLSHIYDAATALFEHVGERYRCIRMQLLAAGGTDKYERRADIRTYPERFSFVQIVRAWAKWRDDHPNANCRLALHIVLDSVYQDIASGRIDVLELLSCKDIRFFVEIVSDKGEVERRIFQNDPDDKLKLIVDSLGLSEMHWMLEVSPPSTFGSQPRLSEALDLNLQQLGVVPGSTLHFRRPRATISGSE